MKPIISLLFATSAFYCSVSPAATYDCNAYRSNWYGVTPLTSHDSRKDELCGHVILDSSSIPNSTAFIEKCDSLVVSVEDISSTFTNLGGDGQMAQVRLLKSGKASEWQSRDFEKQSTLEQLGVSKGFRLDLALDQSNLIQKKNLSYGVTCKIVEQK